MTPDPEALRYRRPSIRKRVLDALRAGPASERTLTEIVGADLHAVSTCIKSLRGDRLVVRLGPVRRKGGVYALAEREAAWSIVLADTS